MKKLSGIASLYRVAIMVMIAGIALLSHQPAYSQCSLSMEVSSTPVTQLSPADIDFEHFESRSLLFTVNITNSNDIAVNAKMDGYVDVFLADGTQFDNPHAATFKTKQFSVPPGGRIITNLNIGRNADIGTESFNFDEAAKNRLQDIGLSTGKFPSGRYVFHIELYDLACNPSNPIKSDLVTFTLENPSRTELRSPQDGETTNEFPFLEFFTDGNRAILTVAEVGENQSREEAISRKPAMLEKELVGQNSLLYTGGRPLEQGKTYAWQVTGKSTGIGGSDVDVPSPIWTFTVSATPLSGTQSAATSPLLDFLASKHKAIYDMIEAGGFITGACTHDGASISQTELLNILNELIDGEYEVTFE